MSHLLSFDFDGSIARTFQPSPNGVGVHEAYALAIHDIFGSEGMQIYDNLNGLKNRAPTELTHLLLDNGSDELVQNATRFFTEQSHNLNGFVPPDKGVPLIWNSSDPYTVISELLVRQKLSYLLDQVGAESADGYMWPQPCRGFIPFWESVQELKENDIPITTAIISSGHQTFIEKFFDQWQLKQPDIMVTEDDIRGKRNPRDISRRVKPGQFPLAAAHLSWLKSLGYDLYSINPELARETRNRIIYFGDDPIKDGKLANGRVVFGLMNEDENLPRENVVPNSFRFHDWTQISDILNAHQSELKNGISFQELFIESNMQIETVKHGHSVEGL